MRKGKGASIMDYFETLEDPRIDRCKRHQMLDIIAIAICAVICGADSWVYIELFGKSKLEWFRTFLELPHGIPSHDTFGDVFSRLDPQFQQCFMAWTQAVSDLIPLVAIDGKTVRRSHDRNSGQRVFSAWVGQHADPGAGEDRGEVQRNHRHPPVLQSWTAGVHRHYRRHGLPAGDRPGDSDRGAGYVLALKEHQGHCMKTCGTCSRERRSSASRECPTTTPPP